MYVYIEAAQATHTIESIHMYIHAPQPHRTACSRVETRYVLNDSDGDSDSDSGVLILSLSFSLEMMNL